MRKKSASGSRKRFTLTVKKEIIAKHENGIRVSDIAKLTISTIIYYKKKHLMVPNWLKE